MFFNEKLNVEINWKISVRFSGSMIGRWKVVFLFTFSLFCSSSVLVVNKSNWIERYFSFAALKNQENFQSFQFRARRAKIIVSNDLNCSSRSRRFSSCFFVNWSCLSCKRWSCSRKFSTWWTSTDETTGEFVWKEKREANRKFPTRKEKFLLPVDSTMNVKPTIGENLFLGSTNSAEREKFSLQNVGVEKCSFAKSISIIEIVEY